MLELLSAHGARLTTAAQMVWAQVLQPGDVAVDATCGNGHDSLFMAQCIGPTGHLHAVDLQVSPSTCRRHTSSETGLCSLHRAASLVTHTGLSLSVTSHHSLSLLSHPTRRRQL